MSLIKIWAKTRTWLTTFLEEQAEKLVATYREWFDMDTRNRAEGWVLLGGTRR